MHTLLIFLILAVAFGIGCLIAMVDLYLCTR